MTRLRAVALSLAISLPLTLPACGDSEESADVTAPDAVAASDAAAEPEEAAEVPTLAEDGPGVCFDRVTEHLGADAKVNEVYTSFSVGKEIDPDLINPEDTAPAGDLEQCNAQYQDPDDPNKLLQITMDVETGTFGDPAPMEISVMGGDASSFKLDDYVIALSEIDTAPLAKLMDQQQSKLDGAFSRHAWSNVRLSAPDTFSNVHLLRLDVSGRLRSNDIKESGYMEVSTSGGRIEADASLVP